MDLDQYGRVTGDMITHMRKCSCKQCEAEVDLLEKVYEYQNKSKATKPLPDNPTSIKSTTYPGG